VACEINVGTCWLLSWRRVVGENMVATLKVPAQLTGFKCLR